MNPIVKTFEEMVIEAASLILAVDEFTPLNGEKNEVVLAGLQIERDRVSLQLVEYISTNPFLRLMILGEEADRIKNGPELAAIAKDDIRRTLFGD